MTTDERLAKLEDGFERLVALNSNVVELLNAHNEQIAEIRRDARFTQKIWVAFAQHFGLPPEMWQDDLP